MTKTEPCPCGKDKPYTDCCQPFINGDKIPKTPEQLMRSRYTAYALGGHGKYLLKTWFPITARGLSEEELSDQKCRWLKLEVLAKEQDVDSGTVEFKAHYQPLNDQSGKPPDVLHEKSEFRRLAGHWFYVGGRVK